MARRFLPLIAMLVAACGAKPALRAASGPTSLVPEAPRAVPSPGDDDARRAFESIDGELVAEWDGLAPYEGEPALARIEDDEQRLEVFVRRLEQARLGHPSAYWEPVFLAREASVRETFRRTVASSQSVTSLSATVTTLTAIASIEAKANKTLASPSTSVQDKEAAQAILAQAVAVRANLNAMGSALTKEAASKAPDDVILFDYARAWLLGRRAGTAHPRASAAIGGAAMVCLRMTPQACAATLEHAQRDAGATLAIEAQSLAAKLPSPAVLAEEIIWTRYQLASLCLLPVDSTAIDSTRTERAIAQLTAAANLARESFILDPPPLALLLKAARARAHP